MNKKPGNKEPRESKGLDPDLLVKAPLTFWAPDTQIFLLGWLFVGHQCDVEKHVGVIQTLDSDLS